MAWPREPLAHPVCPEPHSGACRSAAAIKSGHSRRRRRVEFLDFMNKIVADHPGKKIHVVLDNLSTHKRKCDRWLARHRNVHFHFTPTHVSWLNQIEIWFSIMSRAALAGASFTSPKQARKAIDDFIACYNKTAQPFAWRNAVVHKKSLKPRYSNL